MKRILKILQSGWPWTTQWETLRIDFLNLAFKLEELGLVYDKGIVVPIYPP
jgi:hypothetical protein